MLVVQSTRPAAEFVGRYDVVLDGTFDGRPWSQLLADGPLSLRLQQTLRLQASIDHPAEP